MFALSEGQNGSHPPNEFISVSHSEGHRPGHLRRTRGAGTEGHRSASTPRRGSAGAGACSWPGSGCLHVMTGLPYMIWLVVPTLGLCKPKVPVGGMDVAERVAAVGRQVTRFRPAMRSLTGATGPTPSAPPLAKTTSRRNRRRGLPVRARRVHRRELSSCVVDHG